MFCLFFSEFTGDLLEWESLLWIRRTTIIIIATAITNAAAVSTTTTAAAPTTTTTTTIIIVININSIGRNLFVSSAVSVLFPAGPFRRIWV